MEVLFVLLFLFIISMVSFVYRGATQRTLNNAFAQVAERYGGQLVTRATWKKPHPIARFAHNGGPVELSVQAVGGKNRRRFTQLQLAWPKKDGFDCEVFPRGFFSRLGVLLGTPDIKTGSPAFDHEYVVRGTASDEVRTLISPQVRASIAMIRNLSMYRDIYLVWRDGSLVIQVQGVVRDPQRLHRFTELGLELLEFALSTRAEGIDFVTSEVMPDGSDAMCQVCGDFIPDEEAVFCRSCKTPHHRECWKYFGACSIYGCGQKRFVRRRELKRLQ